MSEKPWYRRLSVGAGRAEASLGKSQAMKRHSVSIHGQSKVSSCTRPGLQAGEVDVQCRERPERASAPDLGIIYPSSSCSISVIIAPCWAESVISSI